MVTSPVILPFSCQTTQNKQLQLWPLAWCVPADLSLGLSFTTGAAVTGGLLVDRVDKARTTGSTTVGWHDTETQIEMQIRKHNRVKPT